MREHARSTGDGAVDLGCALELVRHDDVADAFARQREGLAVGVADERVAVVARNVRDGVALVGDLAVRLIGDDVDRVAVLLLLAAENGSELLDRLFRVDGTARVVRRIDDDGLRVRRQARLKGRKVNLEVLDARRHDDELAADRFDEAAVLGEERRERDEFIAFLAERLEANRDGSGSAGRHEEVLARKMRAEAVVDAPGQRLANLRIARRDCVAVDSLRRHRLQDVDGRLLDEFRRRHIRVAKAEIVDILLTDLRRALAAKLKDRADRRLLCTEFIHLL